jgi:aspartyl-tRNA synthetase
MQGISRETVISVTGTVEARDSENVNPKLHTWND